MVWRATKSREPARHPPPRPGVAEAFRRTAANTEITKTKNSGNEAKKYLKTKDITFLMCANYARFARKLAPNLALIAAKTAHLAQTNRNSEREWPAWQTAERDCLVMLSEAKHLQHLAEKQANADPSLRSG